jgi:subtilisin family serine protease
MQTKMRKRLAVILALLGIVLSSVFGPGAQARPLAAPLSERTRPQTVSEFMVEVVVKLDTETELERLAALGFACDHLGDCTLQVTRYELKVLQQAGFELQAVEQAVVLRLDEDDLASTPEATTDTYQHGLNGTNVPIPDASGGCSTAVTSVDITGAPAGAIVTRVEYSLRIAHPYVTDLWVFLTSEASTSSELWDGRVSGNPFTGTDNGADDDPADDNDIDFRQRAIADLFDGEPVNQSWSLEAHDCVSQDTGVIDYLEVWIYYNDGPDIRVSPSSLALAYSDESVAAAADPAEALAIEIPADVLTASHDRLYLALEEQDRVRVIVHLNDPLPLAAPADLRQPAIEGLQDQVLQSLPAGEFELTHRFGLSAGFSGWVTRSGLEALLADPQVLMVYEDIEMRVALSQSVPLINADDAHALGYTGQGVTVAVLDTGIDSDHTDLSDDLVAQRCFTHSACPPSGSNESGSAEDGEGHGTSVSGIITSRGAVAPLGVAPDARIVAVKVLDNSGAGYMSDWIAGINWVVANRATYDISIINMSLGGDQYFTGSCDSTYPDAASAVNAAVASGITMFVASGNGARLNSLPAPACLSNTVSVGAVYDANIGPASFSICTDATTAADKVTCFSNSSSMLDLLAPSNRNRTTGLSGGVDDNFGGTSAAAPHAAAAAALLLEAYPSLDPDAVEARLEDGGVPVTDHRTGRTSPRIDALGAININNLSIFNEGSSNLTINSISLLGGSCWLTLNLPGPTPFTIPPGGGQQIEAVVELCVPSGSYADTIRITSNDPDESVVDLPVTLNMSTSAAVLVTPTGGLFTSEDGGAATFTVVLNSQPTASVTIGLSSSDTSEGTVSPSSISFSTTNWSQPRTVTVTGVNDGVIDLDVPYTIILGPAVSADPRYNGWNPQDVSVTNRDNDALLLYLPIALR